MGRCDEMLLGAFCVKHCRGCRTDAAEDDKPSDRHYFYFYFYFGGGKEGNASCTVAPLGAVCGTPVRLASGSILPWTNLPPDLPTKTLPRRCSPATSL
jgi:hypothetical protein